MKRTIFLVSLAAFGLAVTAMPSFAKDEKADASPVIAVEQVSVAPEDKVVCKTRRKTGTRFITKECRTLAQWEAMTEEHRRNIGEVVNRPQISLEKGN